MDVSGTLGLLWLATTTEATALDAGAASALGAFFLKMQQTMGASATFFAVGSTLFSWLLLRGRMIPVPLAWLGLLASVLLVVCCPLQLAGLLGGPVTSFMWFPMLLFEVSGPPLYPPQPSGIFSTTTGAREPPSFRGSDDPSCALAT